ncbi:hypothetical protein [Alicyclobacillus mengziensis]|uniref:Lipoprotein n=1 Tax=Alicyclobacillus mengziensis TaxID=2931921 RepID=A0A9X7W0F1_9BACL|nr:hypothetical protein [Alicyclobacillus mengziensis]QSO48463.1 hypothetical protein JZ786_05595 [Alicyclobacillus mengziensis]
MKRFLGIVLLVGICALSVAGCSIPVNNVTNHWVNNKTVSPSSLPSVVVQFVDRAGAKVGDPHPKIINATTDTDDATQKPMYSLVIAGSFTYGTHHANKLPMIVLADGTAGDFVSPTDNTFNKIPLFKQSPAS